MKKFVSILLAFVMIITITSCANTAQPDWQDHLDLGQKYLLDGDYEQAIIEFNKVIEVEPKNVDAYLGLAEAYVAASDYYSAISILEKGYAETENQALQDRINELRGLAAEQTEAVTTAEITTLPETTTLQETTLVPITTSENNSPQDLVPQKFCQISLGQDHSAVITTDGSLYMWGNNYFGQLGNGISGGGIWEYDKAIDSNVPIKVMDNVTFVSLRGDHSAAITEDGSLYMWGANEHGQAGIGIGGGDIWTNNEEIDSNVPLKIMDNVISTQLGYFHSAAITTDGSLYMCGDNSLGQIGNGISGGSMWEYNTGTDSTVPIKIMDNVSSISLGWYHSAAITTDGSLYMWGDNLFGQLGNGIHGGDWEYFDEGVDSSSPIKIMDNVVSVSLGGNHSAAITTDGSLYMWGYNSHGQLGNGTTQDSYVPIKIMDNVASVSLGSTHSAAITTDGSLYMWGENFYGQLGTGVSGGDEFEFDQGIDSNVPIKIMDNVISVSIGFQCSSAITTDGSLYMWGYNEYGQLGNGTTESSNVPIKIEIPAE